MNRYPNIGDHGLIGDLQTAALVTTDGTLDWFCCPRSTRRACSRPCSMPGAAVITGSRRTGTTTSASSSTCRTRAILVTRFMTRDGVGEVHDFMPVIEGAATTGTGWCGTSAWSAGHAVHDRDPAAVRLRPQAAQAGNVRARRGVRLRWPGADHARHRAGGSSLAESGITPERAGDGLRWTRTLREGETGGVVLESMGGTPRRRDARGAQRMADDTARFWRGWLHRSSYTGRWREMVDRSAITLKLMTYARPGRRSRRRPPACPSRPAGSATGTTATPGSGTAPSPSTRYWAWATWRRRPRSAAGCGTGSRAGRQATPAR